MAWTDLDDTKRRVSINDIVEHYGDSEVSTKREYKISCPFHVDKNPSCSINTEKSTWYCHGACKQGGDIFTYVALKEEMESPYNLGTRRRVAEKIDGWFGIVREPPPRSNKAATPKEKEVVQETKAEAAEDKPTGEINPPLKFGPLKSVDNEAGIAYAESRGISREIAEDYGLAVARRGRYKERLVIPLHNKQDVLVGYAARTLNEEDTDKYLFPSHENGFYKSHLVYNLNRLLAFLEIGSRNSVVVVEGFFGCMAVNAAGLPCVALMGSRLYAPQAKQLKEYFANVVLFFDGDEAGEKCMNQSLTMLGAREAGDKESKDVYVRAVRLPENTQPDHFSRNELREMIRLNR